MLIDTHTHLDQPEFDEIRTEVIERALAAGVEAMIAVGITADSSQAAVALAHQHPAVYAAVGIQPNYCAQAKPDDWERIVELAGSDKVVAIGETGLDRHWDYTPFELQQDYFDRHLRLAAERELPFIVHSRDCDEDILAMLRQAHARGALSGVMHSFASGAEMATECLQLGLYISFAGMVTYKKSEPLRKVAMTIPSERLLLETDSPYLSPEPKRGQRPNEPALVVHTAGCVAEVRSQTLEELAALTTANARRLFCIR